MDTPMEMVKLFVMALIPQALAFVVWIAAAVVAGLRWRRHPQVAMLVIIASVTMVLLTVAGTFVSVNLPLQLRQEGRTMTDIGVVISRWSALLGLLRAGCWAMLVVAAFGWRSAGRPAALS